MARTSSGIAWRTDARNKPRAIPIQAISDNKNSSENCRLKAMPSQERRLPDPDFFICVPALGMCRLALQKGICTVADLPENDVFLPLELIQIDGPSGQP